MISSASQNCLELVQTLKTALSSGRQVRLAVLFGSVAKGSQHAASDLDVGVLPAEDDWDLGDELELASVLTRAVGREVDLIRLDQASVVLRWEVARAHIPIFAGASTELPRFVTAAALDHAEMAPLLARGQTRLLHRLAHGQRPRE